MAHPGLNRSDAIIPKVAKAGLDGLECFHSKHSAKKASYYIGVANRHGLLITGGSDCHGHSKGRPLLGTVRLPYAYVEKLKERAAFTRKTATVQRSARTSDLD